MAGARKPNLVPEQTEAARLLGVSTRTLRNWMDVAGFPDCSSGYDLRQIREWRDEQQKKGSLPDEKRLEDNARQHAAKTRSLEAKAVLDELALAEKQGLLVPRDLVIELLAVLATMIRDTSRELQRQGNQGAADLIDDLVGRYEKVVEARCLAQPDRPARAKPRR